MEKKQITMPYDEYEAMTRLIEKQQEAINEFKKGDNVVVVDERYDYSRNGFNWFCGKVPKITGVNAKDMLQAEFDSLHNEMKDVQHDMERMSRDSNKKRNSWWQ